MTTRWKLRPLSFNYFLHTPNLPRSLAAGGEGTGGGGIAQSQLRVRCSSSPPSVPKGQQLHYHCHRPSYLCIVLLNQWLLAKKTSTPKWGWDGPVMPGGRKLHCILHEEGNLICLLLPCCAAQDTAKPTWACPLKP